MEIVANHRRSLELANAPPTFLDLAFLKS